MVLVRKRLVQVMRVTDAVHPCMDTAAVALDRKDMDNTADVRAVIDKRQWMASAVCHNGRGALCGVWYTMGREMVVVMWVCWREVGAGKVLGLEQLLIVRRMELNIPDTAYDDDT